LNVEWDVRLRGFSTMGKYPRDAVQLAGDLRATIEEFVLPGFVPARPLINQSMVLRTLGSCFARHVAAGLTAAGFAAKYTSVVEAINSPLANRALFERVLNPDLPYDVEEHRNLFSRELCEDFRRKIPDEDFFIFTLGVAPVYYLRGTDTPSYMLDPKNPGKYDFRFTTVEQNEEAISFIVQAIKQLNPRAQIILTISPVPLNRAPGIPSAVAADCVSKSILRVAAFNYFSKTPVNVHYWPSFEIVRWLGGHLPPVYGADDGNSRHVNDDLVNMIVALFLKYYCGETNSAPSSASNPA